MGRHLDGHPSYAQRVDSNPHALLEQALSLPVEDRATLASDLLASLETTSITSDEVERLWSVETARRVDALRSGDAQLVSWDHVVEQIDQRR